MVEGLLKKFRGGGKREERGKPDKRPVVIPYIHNVSHNIKKVGEKHGISVLLSAPQKLSKLCGRVERGDTRLDICQKKHATKYVGCRVGVVYRIPLSCGRVYVGQSGRCVNERLREHALSLRSAPSGNLAVHCSRCECLPYLDNTVILARNKNRKTREITEAFFISECDEGTCVSAPSITLFESELSFLRSCMV